MLSRLSIPIRLLLLLAVPLAALMIVGLAGLASINASSATIQDLQARLDQQARLEAMRDIARSGALDTANAVALGTATAARAVERLGQARTDFNAAADAFIAGAADSQRARLTEVLQPLRAEFARVVGEFDTSLQANPVTTANAAAANASAAATPAALPVQAAASGALVAATQSIIDRLGELLAQQRAESNRVIEASRERGTTFFGLNTVLGFAGLALALLFGYYIGRSITQPVQQITTTVQAVAAGDMGARSGITGYDEIAGLGAALDNLLDEKVATLAQAEQENTQLNDSVITLLRAVSQLSRRDLTVRVPVTEDVTGPVADAINQLASETGRVLTDVSRVADQVAAASAQVRTKAESVSAVATTQQSEALDTADKLSHASERLNEIAKLAQRCNELAQRAAQNTESAVVTVTGTLRGMTDIREVIQETGKRIKRLGERSQEISGIVDIINKIAERTTVLALNASMQAAAAGDAGRGFGVVADEVQRLAENTRNAAGQIGALIKSMQVETNDTIGTMENAIGQVVEGSKMAEVAGKQIGDTQGATTALVESVRQIAASSQEQAQLSVTLRDRARTMMSGVRATGEHVSEQLQETVNLTDFSRRLLESVRVFKLPSA